MILIGDLIIRCSSCGIKYTIDTDSLDKDAYSIGEFGMGDRIEHKFAGEVDCDNCGQSTRSPNLSSKSSSFNAESSCWMRKASAIPLLSKPHLGIRQCGEGLPAKQRREQIYAQRQKKGINAKSWGFSQEV